MGCWGVGLVGVSSVGREGHVHPGRLGAHSRGVASNEAEEAVASSLFCARTCTRIGDII